LKCGSETKKLPRCFEEGPNRRWKKEKRKRRVVEIVRKHCGKYYGHDDGPQVMTKLDFDTMAIYYKVWRSCGMVKNWAGTTLNSLICNDAPKSSNHRKVRKDSIFVSIPMDEIYCAL